MAAGQLNHQACSRSTAYYVRTTSVCDARRLLVASGWAAWRRSNLKLPAPLHTALQFTSRCSLSCIGGQSSANLTAELEAVPLFWDHWRDRAQADPLYSTVTVVAASCSRLYSTCAFTVAQLVQYCRFARWICTEVTVNKSEIDCSARQYVRFLRAKPAYSDSESARELL